MCLDDFLNKPIFRHLRDLVATAKAIVFFASPTIAGVTVLSYLISTQVRSDASLFAISVTAVFTLVAVLSGLGYYALHVCDPAPYKITSIEGLLTVERANEHHHRYVNRRVQVIKATRNNVRLVEHQTHWTSSGSKSKHKARSLNDSQQLIVAAHAEEDGRTPHWIYLGRSLGKGDSESVGFEEIFEDNYSPMLPYYREGGGRYKSRNLKITVRFSINEDPGSVDGLVWNNDRKSRQRHVVGDVTVNRRPDPVARTVDYIVAISKPRRYHSYGVRWKWSPLPENYVQPSGVVSVPGRHP
jgi:hypothetical protein